MAALYKEQLGRVIAERRSLLGMSQKELAAKAGIEEPQTVSRWERGLNAPVDLDAVARALETSAAELLKQLEPVTARDRRRLEPRAGTQLDRIERALEAVSDSTKVAERIERKLDALLEAVRLLATSTALPDELVEQLLLALLQEEVDAQAGTSADSTEAVATASGARA